MSDQRTPPFQAENSSSNNSAPANRLRALLERAELSQRGAARLLGIDERTVRMWCAGQGTPPEYVFRSLDPRLTYREHLRQRIEMNERHIEVLESGRHEELPRAYRPVDASATQDEVHHLRKRNETYRSILRLDDSFHNMQDAYAVIVEQSLTPGGFGLTPASIQAFDIADQEFQSANAAVNLIANEIKSRVAVRLTPSANFTIRVIGNNPHRPQSIAWKAGQVVIGMEGCWIENIVDALTKLESDTSNVGVADPARWLTHFAGLESEESGKKVEPWIEITHCGQIVTNTKTFRELIREKKIQ